MSQKKNVSLRLSESDLGKIKEISQRLGVKEADLLRFTVRQTLGKLMAFKDQDARGVDLIPALIECGSELTHYLELDGADLERIVNGGVINKERMVDPEDLDILVSTGIAAPHVHYKSSELRWVNNHSTSLINSLKNYLAEKYLGRNVEDLAAAGSKQVLEPLEGKSSKIIPLGENEYAY